MKYPFHFLVKLLIIYTEIGEIMGTKENYNGIIETLKFPEKFLFDITKPLNKELKKNSPNCSFNREIELETLGVRLSPLLYYGQDRIRYSDSGFFYTDGDCDKSAYSYPRNGSISVSFIQNRSGKNPAVKAKLELRIEEIANLKRNKLFNFEKLIPIFKAPEWDAERRSGGLDNLEQLIEQFKTQWPNIKVGLEYNIHNSAETLSAIRSSIRLIDVLIVSIDIEPNNFILSYTQFKRYLRELLNTNYDFTQTDSSHITFYAKLNFLGQIKQQQQLTDTMFPNYIDYSDQQIDQELYQKYYYYLMQFAVYWINDNEKEGLILDTFSNVVASKAGLQGSPLNDLLVIPFLSKAKFSDLGVCAVKATLEHIHSHFKTVMVKSKCLMELVDDKNTCVIITDNGSCDASQMEREVCKWPEKSNSLPDINLSFHSAENAVQEVRALHLLPSIQRLLHGDLNWKQIQFDIHRGEFNEHVMEHEVKPLLNVIPPGLPIACDTSQSFARFGRNGFLDYTDVIQGCYEDCEHMWNQSNIIIWNIRTRTIDYPNSALVLTQSLTLVELERQKFLRLFPEKTVFIRFVFGNTLYSQKPEDIFTLYCRPDVLLFNELGEIILHFARINKIPLEIADVLGYFEEYHGGLKAIVTIPELKIENTKFPAFIARDYPDKFLLGKFPTDPCIYWTRDVPRIGLQINSEHSGTTLYIEGVNNRRLTTEELEIMLLFTLHKFSLVEIIPETFTDINTILKLLSKQEFVERLAIERSKVARLFLRVDLKMVPQSDMKLQELFQQLLDVTLKPAGIHFLNSDNNTLGIYETYFKMLKEAGIMVGISLENCVEEANAQFFNLKKLSQFLQHDYLLCNMELVAEATNVNTEKVVKYLDTTLYIQKYFQRMFPKVSMEILFRLNTVTTKSNIGRQVVRVHGEVETVVRDEISNFLTFFEDVNQYASLYKLKMFMLPTFDDMRYTKFGWWRVLDFESLANSSVFVEKEAEYLDKEFWRPKEPRISPLGMSSLIVAIIGTLLIVLISVIVSVLIWYRRRYVLLTKKEVREFQYGMIEKGSDDRVLFENLKFPNEYHISKRRIILQNIVGKGNFGLVYKATYSLEAENESVLTVAVKIPHPNCTREAFKSLLSELKILCYVGSHPHVVGFVGAYIKEIGRGIVNIATELCENGALQEYLRKLHSQQAKDGKEVELGTVNPNLYKLCQFAQEIASGMDFISSKKIVHGDLSTRNVLLDTDFRCKIADFGLSRKLYEYQEYIKKSSEPLPWRWLAIESLKRMEFTTKSDVWSYGITLWEIFSLGSVPYPGLTWTDQFVADLEKGNRMSTPLHATTQIYEEMKICWNLNPAMRPTFTELSRTFETIRNSEYVHVAIG